VKIVSKLGRLNVKTESSLKDDWNLLNNSHQNKRYESEA